MSSILLPDQRATGRRGFEILLPSTDTGGTLGVVEVHFPAGTAGPPVHVHSASEETYVVLEGTLLMYVDGKVSEVTAGGVAYISRGTEHTYATRPGIAARFMTLHTPGGYERYHTDAVRAEEEKGGPLVEADLFALAGQFDWKLAGSQPMRLLPTGALIEARRADEEAARAVREAR
jgi:mannose-6-phosphate isomerase-like protein (cupin superfamily)